MKVLLDARAARARLIAAAGAFLLSASPLPLQAQGLDAEGAIDTIVGSEITTGEEEAGADEDRIIAAIENTPATIAEVRKKFSLDAVEIVFLPDVGPDRGEDGAVDAKVEEFGPRIAELREAIEGSAMFYHAINSNRILLRDIVALEFDDDNGVTIFVAGTQP